MNTKKILTDEISDIKVSSLPSRPTAPTAFGGKGYTAAQMKAAFDRLPLFIIERFNMLLDDISSVGDGSISAEIPTGIGDGHTLCQFFTDIESGELAKYLSLGDMTLDEFITAANEKSAIFEEQIAICFLHIADLIIDGGSPASRSTDSGEVVA